MTALLVAAVFLLAVAYDWAFAAYVRAAADGLVMRAAGLSTLCYLVGAGGLLAVVRVSPWFVLVEAVGLGVGTALGVRGR